MTRAARLLVLAIALRAAPSAADTLCNADEKPIFSCVTNPDDKYVSVCLAASTLFYRLGKPGKIELEIPAVPAELTRKYFSDFGAGGQMPFVAFALQHGDVRYEIDSAGRLAWMYRGSYLEPLIDCAPALLQMHWELLDGIVPLTQATPADMGMRIQLVPARRTSAAPAPKPAAAGLVCASPAPLTGLRKQIADQFRAFAEQRQPFYALAVAQFGAPESCSVTEEDVPRVADKPGEPTRIDEANFAGTLVYSFKGATLTLTSRYRLDALLTAPGGFPNQNAALVAAQDAAKLTFRTVRSTMTSDDAAGTRTETFTSDADGAQTADLTTRGETLIAIHAH